MPGKHDEDRTPWPERIYYDFAAALGEKPPHRGYDLNRPPSGQFRGVHAVFETDGSLATPEMIDEAAARGVAS